MSSNPSTDTSSGTRSPASRIARIAPIAEMSLKANSAVARGRTRSSRPRRRVAEIRQRAVAVQLPDQRRIDGDPFGARRRPDRLPADGGVRAERLALDERDAAVAERPQVRQRLRGGAAMVDHDVRDAVDLAVPRHRHHGHGQRRADRRVDQDQAIDRSVEHQPRVLVDEVGAMPVAGDEVQVAGLQQRVFDPAHHQRRIAFADLRHHHADGQRAAVPQRLRDRVGPVAGRRGGGADRSAWPAGWPAPPARGSTRARPTPARGPADPRARAA